MSYIETSLTLIKSSELLDDNLLSALEPLKDELAHTFVCGQIFRSRWEMENSVLNDMKFPTPDAKYWQSVREEQVHFQELVMLSYEFRMNAEKLKVMEAQLAKDEANWGEFESNEERRIAEARLSMKRIQIERMRFMMLNQQRTAQDRIREIVSWHEIMEGLKPQMRHGTDSYEHHQTESYRRRFNAELSALRRAGTMGNSASEIRNITALADMSQKAVRGGSDTKCNLE